MLASLLAFTVAAALLTMAPGLDTALVLRTAAVEGPRRAYAAALGIGAGCFVWGMLAVAGLGVVLLASELAYRALQMAGALYLGWLGLKLIFGPRAAADAAASSAAPRGGSAWAWFGRGLMTNLLNPKAGLFYVTFMPQFIPADANVFLFGAALVLIHDVEGILWFTLLIAATRPLAAWLRRPAVTLWLDRATGGLFLAFGAKLALDQRA
ncbi:LysE family translocator [Desertibaculum subflavum]|uniref:LysE family translocator n=1 Tax=Desertibaculum subflavum TaxID=2268458 RepID=UPI000E6717E2